MFRISDLVTGRLKLSLKGEGTETFFNNAAKNGIVLRNLVYKEEEAFCYISPADFKRLIPCRRGTSVKAEIIEKFGLVFIFNRYKKHPGFFAGLITALIILKILSLFVWSVEVTGNKTVPKEEIIKVCNDLGVTEGKLIGKIDEDIIPQKILLKCRNLTWCSLNKEGCVITINVSEGKLKPKEEIPPVDLISSADGKIKKIDVVSGETLVNIGDKVSKGDILVSGSFQNAAGIFSVVSKGKIIAKTTRTFTETAEFYEDKWVTDKIKHRTVFSVFSVRIPLYLGSIHGKYTCKTEKYPIVISGKEIPVSRLQKTFYIKKKVTVRHKREELVKILNGRISEKIKKLGIKDYKITSNRISENKKSVTVIKTVTATENIAKKQ